LNLKVQAISSQKAFGGRNVVNYATTFKKVKKDPKSSRKHRRSKSHDAIIVKSKVEESAPGSILIPELDLHIDVKLPVDIATVDDNNQSAPGTSRSNKSTARSTRRKTATYEAKESTSSSYVSGPGSSLSIESSQNLSGKSRYPTWQ
jgi:hypothetical protein